MWALGSIRERAAACQRLLGDRRGSTLPLIAAAILPMVGALGGAVDFTRLYLIRTQMQAGVDAGALAGGNAFDNTNDSSVSGRRQQVIDHFRDNFTDGYMGVQTTPGSPGVATTRVLQEPVFETVNGISRTTVRATGTVPMTFMSILGLASQPVSVMAQVEYQPHPLEVQVVLDNTGSMNDQIDGVSKMTALKAAMHSFINVLYQGGTNNPNLALGINNYTITTNVGAILKNAGVKIQTVPGYTDGVGWEAGNNMGWKGCVGDDETITNMSSDLTVKEGAAFDIWPSLPGEMPKSDSPRQMVPIRPYMYPPSFWSGKAAPQAASPSTDTSYFNTSGNFYSSYLTDLAITANSALYKRYFYRLYVVLNDGSGTMSDDVIVSRDAYGNDTYYDPTAADAFNPLTGTGKDFYVRTDKLPNRTSFKAAPHYDITKYNVAGNTPNYQCPEAALPIVYNIPRSTYDNFIDQKVWPVYPANGTMHHIGLIWGFRMLARYDVFTRTKPVGSSAPRRALVFMTDGKTELSLSPGQVDKTYTAYGTPADGTIIPAPTAANMATSSGVSTIGSNFYAAVDLRFAKACAIANSTTFADSGKLPMIFVVAINKGSAIDTASQNRLKACGTSGYWLTTSSDQLANAFATIARTLIDVHLTR